MLLQKQDTSTVCNSTIRFSSIKTTEQKWLHKFRITFFDYVTMTTITLESKMCQFSKPTNNWFLWFTLYFLE